MCSIGRAIPKSGAASSGNSPSRIVFTATRAGSDELRSFPPANETGVPASFQFRRISPSGTKRRCARCSAVGRQGTAAAAATCKPAWARQSPSARLQGSLPLFTHESGAQSWQTAGPLPAEDKAVKSPAFGPLPQCPCVPFPCQGRPRAFAACGPAASLYWISARLLVG